ncbi:MAG: toprim domain-containing protein [Candidatus Obscuribacter sp.]|nr:toprim domain-containing protein [Candidatus Obscuribacter sp.]MBP6348766.1 toprim domain-containing protein [Candidatus Obscuribacter sp.]MBP6591638.1 toprim domain-containing protein [Candidatus Obscuribacter sp.]MBP7575822.1 toprim domain-containing protein [Candidatus Obscuribacter sp.]
MIDQCYTPDKGANQTRRDSLKSALRHHWEEVLIQAGINPAHLSGRHNACPICGGSDRFRFDDQEGDGTFYCNQCGAGDGFKLLMLLKGIGFGAVLDLLDGNRTELEQLTSVSVKRSAPISEAQRKRCRDNMLKAWSEAKTVSKGDPVWLYLNHVRKLDLSTIPDTLRYHAGLKTKNQDNLLVTAPAMVAAMTNLSGAVVQVHRTFLTIDGQKAFGNQSKKLMRIMDRDTLKGSAIKLYEPTEQLGLAEGIETALACARHFELPTWSVFSSVLLKQVDMPESVKEVFIFADNDQSGVGKASAEVLAEKLTSVGKVVKIIMPPNIGADWCDVITGARA